MPANIEIKARVRDFDEMKARAARLSDSPVRVIPQVDTFFNMATGRLKLRELDATASQLIYYERPDLDGPKRSEYSIYETHDPAALKEVLAAALGVRGTVSKVRHLYLVGQTRIHLDHVEGLGDFVELEVVLDVDQSDHDGRVIADRLIQQLHIRPDDLVETAYVDLLERGA